MAPGPRGSLYVSVPKAGNTVLARLDASGRPSPGWPKLIKGASPCGLLLPVNDGSVRVVCQFPDDQTTEGPPPERAFAFDAGGRPLPGWPVELPCCFTGRVIGDELTVYVEEVVGSDFEVGWIVTVTADGTVHQGSKVPLVPGFRTWAVGPDGVAYGIVTDFGADPSAVKTSQLWAVGPAGVPAGFPVAIDGIVSPPAFDAAGRIHVIVGAAWQRPTRTLVFAPDARALDAGSGELDIAASGECAGIEGSCERPAPPLVSRDGTTFVIGSSGGRMTVVGVGPSGQLLGTAWPYRSDAAQQPSVICPVGIDGPCDSINLAAPAIGPGGVLYLLHAAVNRSVGGSMAAIGPDGRGVSGWPVGLRRSGSAFWSVVVAPDGTAYALAIEPETGGEYSATVLAVAPDSTVLYTTTIIDP
ncbi:MAG TPA: hypothetical protein VJZ72_12360 [Candidatus Limnocylindrales bacterium]|nr:hypothetical protein [Candidatus Limnocylindrales bacterium]